MVKYYSASSLIRFTWDQVASALWQRYPNPHSKHVLSEDVVSREIINNKLHTKRLLTKTNLMPKWGERILPMQRQVCIVEESIVDPESRTMVTYTRNIGLQRFMTVEEKCVYRVSSDNSRWTVCERWAQINSGIFGLSRAIVAFGIERFKKNIIKTTKGLEYTLEKLYLHEGSAELRLHGKEKLKETARKAKELAKRPVLPAHVSP